MSKYDYEDGELCFCGHSIEVHEADGCHGCTECFVYYSKRADRTKPLNVALTWAERQAFEVYRVNLERDTKQRHFSGPAARILVVAALKRSGFINHE